MSPTPPDEPADPPMEAPPPREEPLRRGGESPTRADHIADDELSRSEDDDPGGIYARRGAELEAELPEEL